MAGDIARTRILVVDDQEGEALAISKLLQRKIRAEVGTANDCASARAVLSSSACDLIILDHQLPDGNGLSLLQEIVEREGAPPVIIVTGHGDEQTAVSAFKLGASGYVVKDARMSTLLIEEARSALARAELERVEKELASERERARKYLEVAGIMILALDRYGDISMVNRKCCEVLGYEEGELLGKSWFETCQPEDAREHEVQIFDSIMSGDIEGNEVVENRVVTKSGEERFIRWRNSAIEDESGGIVTALSSGEDITERKRAEDALRDEREFVDTAINALQDGFYVLSVEGGGKLVRWNKMFNDVTGFSDEELSNMTVFDFFDEEGKKEQEQFFLELLEKGKAGIEIEIITIDGRRVPCHSQATMIRDAEGNPLYVCGVARDITERKRADAEVRRLTARLTEEGENVRVRIAMDLHDDIGQSLNALKLAFDIQCKKGAGVADDETRKRMAKMRDMLAEAIGRVRSMTGELVPAILTDLGLESALESHLEGFARDTGTACAFKTDGNPARLGAEVEISLFRVAQEALTNIQKHSKASSVGISITWGESLVSLSVCDDGAGFDVDQVYAEGLEGGHFGLIGMRERARMYGAEFNVESEPGAGTTVNVTVPLERG